MVPWTQFNNLTYLLRAFIAQGFYSMIPLCRDSAFSAAKQPSPPTLLWLGWKPFPIPSPTALTRSLSPLQNSPPSAPSQVNLTSPPSPFATPRKRSASKVSLLSFFSTLSETQGPLRKQSLIEFWTTLFVQSPRPMPWLRANLQREAVSPSKSPPHSASRANQLFVFTTNIFSTVMSSMLLGIPPIPKPDCILPPNGIQSTRNAV